MVIDSSAFIAIVVGEPERAAFSQEIVSQPIRLTSAATLLETTLVVLGRKGEPGVAALQAFIETTSIETAAFTPEHLDLAINAFRRFGKGRHPAALNFGDCFSYALAKATGEPLLSRGTTSPRPISGEPYDHACPQEADRGFHSNPPSFQGGRRTWNRRVPHAALDEQRCGCALKCLGFVVTSDHT